MMTEDQLRAALYGRSVNLVARDTGISRDALYRFMGKPLSMFDQAILSDYLEGLQEAVASAGFDDAGTWGELAKAVEGCK